MYEAKNKKSKVEMIKFQEEGFQARHQRCRENCEKAVVIREAQKQKYLKKIIHKQNNSRIQLKGFY